MISKKIVLSVACMMSASSLYADVEDDIFKSGVERTLQVLAYQKHITETNEADSFAGKLCYQVHPKDGETALSDFQVVKLEALSLIADTKPFYYKKDNQKSLCFFVAKDKETYEAYKKLIENKYEDITAFHPQKTVVPKGAKPILPKLGEWHINMDGTIEALNREIADLKRKAKVKSKEIAKMKSTIKKVVGAVTSLSRVDLDTEQEATPASRPKEAQEKTGKEIVKLPAPEYKKASKKENRKSDTAKKSSGKIHI